MQSPGACWIVGFDGVLWEVVGWGLVGGCGLQPNCGQTVPKGGVLWRHLRPNPPQQLYGHFLLALSLSLCWYSCLWGALSRGGHVVATRAALYVCVCACQCGCLGARVRDNRNTCSCTGVVDGTAQVTRLRFFHGTLLFSHGASMLGCANLLGAILPRIPPLLVNGLAGPARRVLLLIGRHIGGGVSIPI